MNHRLLHSIIDWTKKKSQNAEAVHTKYSLTSSIGIKQEAGTSGLDSLIDRLKEKKKTSSVTLFIWSIQICANTMFRYEKTIAGAHQPGRSSSFYGIKDYSHVENVKIISWTPSNNNRIAEKEKNKCVQCPTYIRAAHMSDGTFLSLKTLHPHEQNQPLGLMQKKKKHVLKPHVW